LRWAKGGLKLHSYANLTGVHSKGVGFQGGRLLGPLPSRTACVGDAAEQAIPSWTRIILTNVPPLAESSLDFSVVMATRDRPDILDRCLAAFARVEAREVTWEFVVVDDGEDPRTQRVLDKYASVLPLVRRKSAGGEGKNRSLNLAIPGTRGAVVVFVDDDVLPASGWLTGLEGACGRWPQHEVFGGRILPNFPGDVPEHVDLTWSRIRDALVIGDWGMPEGPCDPARVWGPNMAVRRSVLIHHRFDEARGPRGLHYAMGGDSEFILRVTAEGREAIHLPDWTVEHMIRAEQFEPAWLKARAFRAGRHDAFVAFRADAIRLFGAPPMLYLHAIWNHLRSMIHRGNERKSLRHGMWSQLARGQIHQHRLMRRSGR
jgi:glycosyltransferase involved in cell wall biosynthesis